MLRCTTDKYERLYARWLSNSIQLLEWGGPVVTYRTRVLDLCGGTGIVARQAKFVGAGSVHLLDLNPRCQTPGVVLHRGRAEEADRILADEAPFDVIICRQAVGYLEPSEAFRAVGAILAPGGRFVFNTFLEPRWRLQTYNYHGVRFLEASGYWGKHVFHLQASPRIGADVTHFRYHTKHELITALLEAGFGVKIHERGRSIRFLCHHKAESERIRGLRKQAKSVSFGSL